MKMRMGQIIAVGAACCALLAPQMVQAEGGSVIGDIQLGRGGTLSGQVVNRQGQPVAQREVTLVQGEHMVARATTDERGNFAVSGLQSGVYGIQSNGRTSVHRLWTAQTAPPAAHRGVMIVSGAPAVRGQIGGFSALGAVGAGAAAVGGYVLLDEYVLDNDHKPAS